MTQLYGLSAKEAMLLPFGTAVDYLRMIQNTAAEKGDADNVKKHFYKNRARRGSRI